ncbi:MAG: response regulator [Geobacter sp.]|nr:response regulator [Geobacter sp.]MSM40642.1 response regulator [Geobacter sp.]
MNIKPILLVEDQPDDQFLTLRTLRKLKITNVMVANEGEEALRFLQGDKKQREEPPVLLPSLILLDLRMPKVDGFEFLEALRSDERIKEIPVIVLTSSPQEKDQTRCMQLGVKAYLNKPLDVYAFDRAMQQIGTA